MEGQKKNSSQLLLEDAFAIYIYSAQQNLYLTCGNIIRRCCVSLIHLPASPVLTSVSVMIINSYSYAAAGEKRRTVVTCALCAFSTANDRFLKGSFLSFPFLTSRVCTTNCVCLREKKYSFPLTDQNSKNNRHFSLKVLLMLSSTSHSSLWCT